MQARQRLITLLEKLPARRRYAAELLVRYPWARERDLPLVAPVPISYAALVRHRKGLLATFGAEHRLHLFAVLHGLLLTAQERELLCGVAPPKGTPPTPTSAVDTAGKGVIR